MLTCADNGMGMNLDAYGDKIFRLHKTFHGNPEARGIGLFMTKKQIEAMGGFIDVESRVNFGSTFKVWLHE